MLARVEGRLVQKPGHQRLTTVTVDVDPDNPTALLDAGRALAAQVSYGGEWELTLVRPGTNRVVASITSGGRYHRGR